MVSIAIRAATARRIEWLAIVDISELVQAVGTDIIIYVTAKVGVGPVGEIHIMIVVRTPVNDGVMIEGCVIDGLHAVGYGRIVISIGTLDDLNSHWVSSGFAMRLKQIIIENRKDLLVAF